MINPDATDGIDQTAQECIKMIPSKRELFERILRSCIQNCLMTDLSGSGLVEESIDDLTSDHRILLLQEVWDELHTVKFEQMAEAAALLSPNRQYTFITRP